MTSRSDADIEIDQPKVGNVSVLIPVYNPNLTDLRELVRSVAQQLLLPREVVVSMQTPSTEAAELLDELRACTRLVVDHPDSTSGMAANWNNCLHLATSRYCILTGQDDRLTPLSLALMERTLSQYGAPIVGVGRVFIDEAGQPITPCRFGNDRRHLFPEDRVLTLSSRLLSALCIRFGNVLGEPSATMFDRRLALQLGGYREHSHLTDLDFNLRMTRTGGMAAYVSAPLTQRRLHRRSQTARNLETGVAHLERDSVLTEELGELSPQLNEEEKRHLEASLRLYRLTHAQVFGVKDLRGHMETVLYMARCAAEYLRVLPQRVSWAGDTPEAAETLFPH